MRTHGEKEGYSRRSVASAPSLLGARCRFLSEQTVATLIDRLLARLSRSRLKPFIRLGRTIRKHRHGVLATRRLKLSNARAEALNNRVKLIVRRAYGFHSADAALALVHLTCGPVKLTLPHEQAFA